MARPTRKTPAELCPEPWPSVASDDQVAEVARRFAIGLRDAMGAESVRTFAGRAGLHHTTLGAVLNGQAWPDLETIAKIERGLKETIWPGYSG